MKNQLDYLKIAGILNFIVSALHIAIIIGGPEWYRFFGAGENAALLAEQGSLRLIISTLLLALIFAVWGLYAWSGSGFLPRLPFLRVCLVLITFVYITRGFIGFVVPFVSNHPRIAELSISFMMWSSSISLCIGLIHLKGTMNKWSNL